MCFYFHSVDEIVQLYANKIPTGLTGNQQKRSISYSLHS